MDENAATINYTAQDVNIIGIQIAIKAIFYLCTYVFSIY